MLGRILMLATAMVSSAALAADNPAPAEAPSETANAADMALLWQHEQDLYAKRGQGDLTYYLSLADREYTVWAPGWEKPNGYAELVKAVADLKDVTRGEVITPELKLIKISRSGNVALVYYSTHRTQAPGGKAADERYDTLHVWIREPSGWLLLGGMARAKT